MYTPDIVFNLPVSMPRMLEDWSSFPSDHGALFIALSVCFWRINRRIGLLAVLFTIVVVLLPRIYVGHHFPGDILVGSLVGLLIALLLMPLLERSKALQSAVTRGEAHPAVLYPLLFMVMFQVAALFEPARRTLDAISKMALAIGS